VRSSAESRCGVLLALVLAAGSMCQPATAALPVAPGMQPSVAEVSEAEDLMRADPSLSHEKSMRVLKWKTREQKEDEKRRDLPAWAQWLRGLFGFLGTAGRAVVWIGAGILAAMLVVFILRVVRERAPHALGTAFVAPTHVRGLDIRPEALPADIGAAARALWDGGEQRAALSLLYRGLLSRLAHQHQAPVRESSTEGECLTLARMRLAPAAAAFAGQLVGTWQRAIYGGLVPADGDVHALCGGFDASLARTAPQ
jgi:hypothetical protein